jgi:hypothetical protein
MVIKSMGSGNRLRLPILACLFINRATLSKLLNLTPSVKLQLGKQKYHCMRLGKQRAEEGGKGHWKMRGTTHRPSEKIGISNWWNRTVNRELVESLCGVFAQKVLFNIKATLRLVSRVRGPTKIVGYWMEESGQLGPLALLPAHYWT